MTRKKAVARSAVLVESPITGLVQSAVQKSPDDEDFLERTRIQWYFGDWESLANLKREMLQSHPERGFLAVFVASGCAQIGKYDKAREFIGLAKEWGVSKRIVSRMLIAGVYNSLGRAAALLSNPLRAREFFRKSIVVGAPKSETALLMQARSTNQLSQIGLGPFPPRPKAPEKPKHMPFEKCLAFNGAYRIAWSTYLNARTDETIASLRESLVEGMDSESREIVALQLDLVAPSVPSRLANYLFIDPIAKVNILPEETKDQLEKIGYFSDQEEKLGGLQHELKLTELPLKELLTESGLSFLDPSIRKSISEGSVIDAGAYIGDTAHLFLLRYKPKRIVALEPHPLTYERLAKNIQNWGQDDAITPINCAVGGEIKEIDLWGSGVGASKIKKVGAGGNEVSTISQRTIDSIASEYALGKVSLIKLDIEGDEYAAIHGARETIAAHSPILLVSIYHTAKDFFEAKPLIASINPRYRFMIRKTTDDLIKEFVLIAYVPVEGS